MHAVRAVATPEEAAAVVERFITHGYCEVGDTVMLFERCSDEGSGKGDNGADARCRAAARRYGEIGV
jgi:hypothetical protein